MFNIVVEFIKTSKLSWTSSLYIISLCLAINGLLGDAKFGGANDIVFALLVTISIIDIIMLTIETCNTLKTKFYHK